MRNKMLATFILGAGVFMGAVVFPLPGQAEELSQIFGRVNELVASKQYPKALEELQWARKEIEKLHNGSLTAFMPDQIAGFVGAKSEITNVLGMTNIERSYTKGEATVKVAIQAASAAGAAGLGALGGLAAIGKMAAMFGGEQGQETVRIQGRTATVKEDEISIFLDSGAVLQVRNGGAASAADLKALVDAIKIGDVDTYLRGQ